MEENSESKNKINTQEEPLKKSTPKENIVKNSSVVDDLNSKDNYVEANNPNNNEIVSEISNKNAISSIKKEVKNENNQMENKEEIQTSETKNKDANNNNEDKPEQNDKSKSVKISKIEPKKEIPIEKKPFIEFVNDHLLPTLKSEFKNKGFEVEDINLKNTSRPIAGDKCWVIYCEIKDICNFWLSFEKDDISSLKSISLCKSSQKPSIIESFLIDEKRITLKLIISRIFQRLNGQKLLGDN